MSQGSGHLKYLWIHNEYPYQEKNSLYTHTCIILTTHCRQHPLSLESFTLGKTQCNTSSVVLSTLDRPCVHHPLQGEHHCYQHLLQDCRVHLNLHQHQDGAVFETGWHNSIDTVYTIGLYYFMQPWIRTCNAQATRGAAVTRKPLQLIMYICF